MQLDKWSLVAFPILDIFWFSNEIDGHLASMSCLDFQALIIHLWLIDNMNIDTPYWAAGA